MKTRLSFFKKPGCNKLQGGFFSPFKVKLLFIILSIIIIKPSYSQLLNETFDGAWPPTGWTFVNVDGVGNEWVQNETSCAGKSMSYTYDPTLAADVWAFTPGVTLTAGVTYQIQFQERTTSTYSENLKVTVGTSPTVVAQTTTLWDISPLSNSTCLPRTANYTCLSTGTYYFAFNCYSLANKWTLYVDEVEIIDVATLLTPISPANGSYLASNYNYSWEWSGGTPEYKLYVTSGTYSTNQLTGTSCAPAGCTVNANEGVSGVPTASSYEWWVSDGWDHTTHIFGGTESSHNTYYLNRELFPTSVWQQAPAFALPGTSSSFYYKIYMTAGNHYLFATCGHDHGDGVSGGSADFDTYVEVWNAAMVQMSNDDCGPGSEQSYIDYTCSSTGTYYVKVFGYSGAFGTYTLAYKTTSTCSPLPVAPTSAVSDRNNFCADDAGNINLSITGGSGTTLRWFTGGCGSTDIGTGNPLTIASPATTTTYYARWENVCGNSTCASATVTVNAIPAAPTGTASQTFCSGTVADLTATGTAIQWYAASSGGSALATSTALVNNTHYYASQTVGGCESATRFDVTVTIGAIAAPTGAASQTFCNSGTVADLTATGTAIQWYAASSGGSALATSTALVNNTHYYASQTVSGCESATRFDVTVTINAPAAPTGAASQTFCNSGTVADLAATGTAIQWYAASSGGSALATSTALVNNTHYYASQTVGGCESATRFDVTVTINPLPDVTATPSSQTICSGSATGITLTSNISGTTFAWTVTQSGVIGATAGSGSSIAQTLTNSGTTAGTVTYTITPTASSCAGTSTNVVITVNPLPDAIATPSSLTICSGDATGISLTGSVSGTTFAWTVAQSGVTGATAGSGSSIAQTLTNSGTTAGTATYSITPMAGGCAGTSTNVIITVNANLTATAGSNSPVCVGGSLNLTSSGGTGYSWSGPNGFTSALQNPVINPINLSGSGTYSVTVSDGVCSESNSINVTVNLLPIPEAGLPQVTCAGNSVTLTASGGGTYQWNGGPATAIYTLTPASTATYTVAVTSGGCTASDSVTVTVNPIFLYSNIVAICQGDSIFLAGNWQTTSGIYNDTLTALTGCDSIFSTNLSINPLPTALITGDTLICTGTLTILTATGGTSYVWSPSTYLNDPNVPNPISTPLTDISYIVTVTDANGCSSTAGTNIILLALPTANAGNDTTILIGNSVQLAATGGTSYVWSPSTYLDDPNVSNPISTPLTDISYIVFVTDANGCSDTDTINVDVDNVEAVFVPTAFAPNGYWQNATLYASGKGIKELDFVVYDRWGEKVWESDKWNNPADGWNGTYKGNKLSAAVFLYHVKAIYYSGEEIKRTGNVTLIR